MEWESDLYDFSDPEVRLEYVPQLGCSVGRRNLYVTQIVEVVQGCKARRL
jgi:hypothetical protein